MLTQVLHVRFDRHQLTSHNRLALFISNSYLKICKGTDSTPASKEKPGPFLVIYGELDIEREDSWLKRAQKTFELLQTTLTQLGNDS
jgi:hypothetical protein